MADHSILFKIGSAYSGEGFKKAQQGCKDVAQQMSAGIQFTSKFAAALQGLDLQAGKSMAALQGLTQAIATGSVVTGALVAGQTALSAVMSVLNDQYERFAALQESIREAMRDSVMRRLEGDAQAASEKISGIISQFDQLNKQATAFASALAGLRAAEGEGGVMRLEVEKFKAGINAATEQAKELSDKEYDVRILTEKKRVAVEADLAVINEAKEAQERNLKAIAELEAAELKASESYLETQRKFDVVAKLYDEGSAEYVAAKKEMDTAKANLTNITNKLTDRRSASVTNELKVSAAQQKLTNTIEKFDLQINVGREEIRKFVNPLTTGASDVAAFAASAEDAAETARKLSEKQKDLAELTALQAEHKRDVIAAEKEYRDALKKYNDNIVANATNEAFLRASVDKGLAKAGVLDAKNQKIAQDQVAAVRVQQGLAENKFGSVKEMERAARFAAREARDAMSRDSGQNMREQARFDRLDALRRKGGEKALNEKDKKFLNDFEALQKAKNAQKAALDKADARRAAAEDAVITIKDMITKLTAA